jgi:hypothetical protein
LLVTRFDARYTSLTIPKDKELGLFSEAKLDVRLWQRFLAQQRLRQGQRVEIIGRSYNGRSAVFLGRVDGTATMNLCARLPNEEESIEVELCFLEPRFKVGDIVRTVPSNSSVDIRSGIVWKVVDSLVPAIWIIQGLMMTQEARVVYS